MVITLKSQEPTTGRFLSYPCKIWSRSGGPSPSCREVIEQNVASRIIAPGLVGGVACLSPCETHHTSAHSSLDRMSHMASTSLQGRREKVRKHLDTWWVLIFHRHNWSCLLQYGPRAGSNSFWFFFLLPVTGSKYLVHCQGSDSIW